MVFSCRLCLAEDPKEKLKNVFQCKLKHAEDSLVDILFWMFSVEIDVTDPLSKDICSECVQLIEYILQVKTTFQKNQETLRNLPGKSGDSLEQHSNGLSNEKVSNNSSSANNSPTNSPSRSRYNLKNIYGGASPRVRVSLSTLEAMCPMDLNVIPFEKTQDYLRYKRLKNGSFKRRKYRHFNFDETLLDDICKTLDDKKQANTNPLNKDVGVSPDSSLMSKAVNTDELSICTCYKKLTSPLKLPPVIVSNTVNNGDNRKEPRDGGGAVDDDLSFLEIVGLAKTTFATPNDDKEYDWTTLSFKKEASTNTEHDIGKKSIGINAKVCTVTTGTLTKRFRQPKKKNVVKVNIDWLECFNPKVVLEPVEFFLQNENYKQIDDFTYIQQDGSSDASESESEGLSNESASENEEIEVIKENKEKMIPKEIEQYPEKSKKQKFLEYYKNFSSFAVRELITGKKIREIDNDSRPIFKITNVCSVFVCEYCSKSFLSQISLNLHYRRAHKIRKSSDGTEVIDLVDNESEAAPCKEKVFSNTSKRKKIRLRERSRKIFNSKDNFKKVDTTSEIDKESHTDSSKTPEGTIENNPNNNSLETGLRRKTETVNYNINEIIRRKSRFKQITPSTVKRKKIMKQKCRPGVSDSLVKRREKTISYVWDRKSLGKYSAISYYRNYLGNENPPLLVVNNCDVKRKNDMALSDTIQKLAHRLDSSSDLDINQQVIINSNSDDTTVNTCT